MQLNFADNAAARVLAYSRIMFTRRVYVLMPEDVRNDVDISRSFIKRRAVSTSEFMRRNFFEGRDDFRVFVHQILHSAHRNARFLGGEKQGVLAAVCKFTFVLIVEVAFKSRRDVVVEEQNRLAAALARNDKGIVFEVQIAVIQSDKLADTNTCAQKQGQNSGIAHLIFFVIGALVGGEPVAAFRSIDNIIDFVAVEADYWLFVKFGSFLAFARSLQAW